MGRGNPGKMVAVRLEPGMLAALEAAVVRRNNAVSITETWDRSEWIRQAIADKLDHYERGRKRRNGRG